MVDGGLDEYYVLIRPFWPVVTLSTGVGAHGAHVKDFIMFIMFIMT
jgi:hypothetical protein